MRLTIENYMKAVYAFLFISSSVCSFFKPHFIPVVALTVLGFIAYDIICYLRDKSQPVKDLQPELDGLKAQIKELQEQYKDIKNDHSIAKIATTFKR